jgi:hypothetical protein
VVSGGLDAAAIRRSWDAVLDAVKERKRTTHAQLMDAQVTGVSGRVLQLGFAHAPIMRQFTGGTGPDVLSDALRTAIGADLDVQCSVAGASAGAPSPAASSATPGPIAAPVYDGFAPGDEAAPEDPDAPAPAAVHGEDAALRLIESELGGRVVSD